MAKAKLSGSLLAHKNVRLVTAHEKHQLTLNGTTSDQSITSSNKSPTSSSFAEAGGLRLCLAIRVGLAICGIAMAVILGTQFLLHRSDRIREAMTVLSSSPPSQSAPKPRPTSEVLEVTSQATLESSSSGEAPVLSAAIPVPITLAIPTTSATVLGQQPAVDAATIPPPEHTVTGAIVIRPEHQSPYHRLSTEEKSTLRVRGDALFRNGDVVSARLFYERAAEDGDSRAALQLGETYDPDFLIRIGISDSRGDSAMAQRWYQRASELGASEAQVLLSVVGNKPDRK